MGILDGKTRLFDTILTPEGKKQLAEGNLKAKFYSFSDYATIYNKDTIVSGGLTDTHRFILEASGLPQDNIIFESDDSGKLSAFPVSGSVGYTILQGKIFSGSNAGSRTIITGSDFDNLSQIFLSHSINAFKNQMIIKSSDPLDYRNTEFIVGPTLLSYSISENSPFKKDEIKEANVNHVESLFFDKRLAHLKNFKFLPPKNKPKIGQTSGEDLGNYVNIGQNSIEDFSILEEELKNFEKKTVFFTETSTQNNLFCQFFEIGGESMSKLDVIDFGNFVNPNSSEPYHVFFVGKLFVDDFGTHTYINMFTLVFE